MIRSNNPFAQVLEEEFQEELKASRSDSTEMQEVPEIHVESDNTRHQLPPEWSIPEAPPSYSEVDPHPSTSLRPQALPQTSPSIQQGQQWQDELPPPMPMRPILYSPQVPERLQVDQYSRPTVAVPGGTSIPLHQSYNEGYLPPTPSQQLPPNLPPRTPNSPSLPPRPLDIYAAPPPRPKRSNVYPGRTGATYNNTHGWR
jgi:hypothetical protein